MLQDVNLLALVFARVSTAVCVGFRIERLDGRVYGDHVGQDGNHARVTRYIFSTPPAMWAVRGEAHCRPR